MDKHKASKTMASSPRGAWPPVKHLMLPLMYQCCTIHFVMERWKGEDIVDTNKYIPVR